MSENSLLQQFTALGDKTRYAIVVSIAKGESLCVSELAERFDVTPAAVSQHMKILEQADVIRLVRDGRKVCCTLNQDSPHLKTLAKLIKQEEQL